MEEKWGTHGKITFKPLYNIKMRYIQWFTREFERRERTRILEQGPTDTSISVKPWIRVFSISIQISSDLPPVPAWLWAVKNSKKGIKFLIFRRILKWLKISLSVNINIYWTKFQIKFKLPVRHIDLRKLRRIMLSLEKVLILWRKILRGKFQC